MVAHSPPAELTLAARARRGARAGLAAVLAALFCRAFVLEIRVVAGDSMSPALLAGDRVLVDRLVYRGPAALAGLLPVRDVRPGDVVLFRSPEDGRTALLKRCVAVPGDAVPGGAVPAGALYLVGDRRHDSRDSRAFGPVARGAVIGRAVAVLGSFAPGDGPRWSRSFRAVE